MATVTNVIEYNNSVETLLKNTVRKIREHNLKSNIAVGVGVVSTIGGIGVFVAGVALIPFTLGGSASLSVIGGGLTLAGASTALGTLAVEAFLCAEEIEEGQQAIDRYVKYRDGLSAKVKEITFPMIYSKMTKKIIENEILPLLRKERENLENFQFV